MLQQFVIVRRDSAEVFDNVGEMFFAPRQNIRGGLRRAVGDFGDAAQKEKQPSLPVAVVRGLQSPVIFVAAAVEVVRKIQNGFVYNPLLHEHQSYQQPPGAAVAVRKRMDGFKLRVRKPRLN